MKLIRITCEGASSVPLERLRNFQGNLKTLEERQFLKLRKSIEKHGFSFPVSVWRDGEEHHIIDGHQRLFVLGKMIEDGFEMEGDIPVDWIEARDVREAKEKVLLAASQYGRYDEDTVYEFIGASELKYPELKLEIDLPQINMGKLEARWFKDLDEKADEVPEPPKKAITKTGDLWLLGDHRLLCGDSRDERNYEAIIDGDIASLVVTDPPYAIKTLAGFGSKGDRNYGGLEIAPLYDEWMPHCSRCSKDNAGFFVWEDWRNVVRLWGALEKNVGKVKDFIVWHVTNRRARQFRKGFYPEFDLCLFASKSKDFEWHFPDVGSRSNVYTSAAVQDDSGVYGKKPVAIISSFIELTTSDSDFVLDPFSGSGTTIIAAEKLNRQCYSIEIEPRYVDVDVERWENYTGKKAKRKKA